MTVVNFGISSDAWENVVPVIENIITQHGFRRVIEIGGCANPTLLPDFIARHGIEYTLLDISQTELDKAPSGYFKLCADICQEDFSFDGQYDFAFSRMLAEHVSSGARFHRNVRILLRDGGMAFHFFPTLFAPPFVLNYLLPERLSESVLHLLQPGRERGGRLGKFPARYSWCRGPIKSQMRKFQTAGYGIETYSGFFGHEPYYRKIPLIHRLHLRICDWLKEHPVPALTSFSQVLLIKR
jgi:hypothetical protein